MEFVENPSLCLLLFIHLFCLQ
uniref:Uncharacterized protein n=1 Tax=Anguilla anguilla TaxID=7936 RepID=A0A0E9V1H9_ANGAN